MVFPQFFTRAHIVLIALLLIATIFGMVSVPLGTSLPVHWGLSGAADIFAPALVALLFPLIMVLVAALLFELFASWRQTRSDFERGRKVISAAFAALEVIALVLLVGTILIGLGQTVDMVRLIVLCVFGLFALIGNLLPKTQPNHLAGLRIPTTLADGTNWRVTHLWTGRLMLASAVIGFVITLFGPPAWAMIVTVALAVFVPLATGISISLAMAARQRAGSN
ncbi:MAG: SdpI family protein [Hyphomicrobiaceae bacterium]|nr:SdpI family protein [Hyphomicrobiaceae bacterium]